MKILTETDSKYKEIELHVCNSALTDEVRAIVGELHEIYDYTIPGTDEIGNKRLIRRAEILSSKPSFMPLPPTCLLIPKALHVSHPPIL